MTTKVMYLPDTGSSNALEVIDVLVKVGDTISVNQALLTLESDKATIDVPATEAGVLKSLKVSVGDKVRTKDMIAEIEVDGAEPVMPKPVAPAEQEAVQEAPAPAKASQATTTFQLPNTGSPAAVSVIELSVKVGERVQAGQTLCILESDKATMDVPAPFEADMEQWLIKVGDKVHSDDAIAVLKPTSAETSAPASPAKPESDASTPAAAKAVAAPMASPAMVNEASTTTNEVYAGPAVRRMARLLDVDLSKIQGSGDKGRISKDDIQQHIKKLIQQAQQPAAATVGQGLNLLPLPGIDFSQYGPIDSKPLSRIKKLTAQNLSRNWVMAPHVTQFEESDITELEAFRKSQGPVYDKQGIKLTPLVFIMKAVVGALKAAPTFNASLDSSGEHLILKKYFHLGIAVDTPDGLVVPVIRDVDQKSLAQLAQELAEVSLKARNQKLTAQDMQGSCFTISSLGGIGGTAFTPIINLPNVAILGVSKAALKPQWDGQQFKPRLMLPLSLSYDHRVIDGAEAARFIVTIAKYLQDIRLLLL